MFDCSTCGHEQKDHVEGAGRCLILDCPCKRFAEPQSANARIAGYAVVAAGVAAVLIVMFVR